MTGRGPDPGGQHGGAPGADVIADLAPGGALRAVINLGNPVLAQGTPTHPAGISVALAGELARRLGVPLRHHCVDAARSSFAAVAEGTADVGFIAVEPQRAGEVSFSRPYAVIEACVLVRADVAAGTLEDLDVPGMRIGVKEGSAYDLNLSRRLRRATIVRGVEGTDIFAELGLEAAAGIRGPIERFAADQGLRVLPEPVSQIRTAVAMGPQVGPATVAWVDATLDELAGSGFLAASLEASGQRDGARILDRTD